MYDVAYTCQNTLIIKYSHSWGHWMLKEILTIW